MASLTIHDLDDALVEDLRHRAAEHDRSLEAEVKAILETARRRKSKAQLRAEAERLAELTRGKIHGDSTDLIREDRDR